ncbi:MAG: hypothetical protein OQK79_06920 [Rhodanobacter sp.]|jgi:hypothetical protein|nr:hypothetical protein [Rhodanobacter sp.]
MSRPEQKKYQRELAVALVVYVAAMLLVWPLAQRTPDVLLKTLLAFVPVLPMLYLIGLMARRIQHSDELEQRTHLVALGVVTALVAALSLIGGFLAAAGALKLDGSILIWVFPVMMGSYGLARWWVATRRYGADLACESGMNWRYRIVLLSALVGMIVIVAWWRGRLDDTSAGILCGMIGGLGILGVIRLLLNWRQRRAGVNQGVHE